MHSGPNPPSLGERAQPRSSSEFHLGVRRRRWVLATLVALMAGAIGMAGVLSMAMAPGIEQALADQRARLAAVEELVEAVGARERATDAWLLTGDDNHRDDAEEADQRVQALRATLSGALDGSGRAVLGEVAAADARRADLDGRVADLVDDGDLDGARALAGGDGLVVDQALAGALSRLRADVGADALRAADDAADTIRLVALALLLPVAPTGWVAYQLVRGLRQLRDIAQQMLEASSDVSSSAAQLSAASEELAATSVEGAAAFSEAMATIEELARAAESIALSVDGVAAQSLDMRANIERAGTDIEESSQRMLALAERVNEVDVILALINEIADQTNLLALNAAIEAARAGEGGKGFAVVAEEVRRLAERSKSSSARIAAIIESAQAETAATVMAMEKGAKQMDHARAFMDTVARASADGRLSAEQQRSATQQVVITFEQLTGNSKAVSATTHQIAASAVGLANLAKGLEATAATSAAGV